MTARGEENMYTAILKEIGADESYMEYLFDESDDEDVGDGDNNLIEDFPRQDTPRGGAPLRDTTELKLSAQKLLTEVANDDDHLLLQWQSESEESGVDTPNKTKEGSVHTPSSEASDSSFQGQVPSWKRMLDVANAKQAQIMDKMVSLQQAQRDSSPRNKIRVTVNLRKPEEGDERSFTSPLVLKELNENDSNLNSSMVSSNSTIQQVSKRNVALQGQWQSQKEKSSKLQDKIAAMQRKLYNEKEQWQKESQELFTPAKSPSKIPKLRSPIKTPIGPTAKTSKKDETAGNAIVSIVPKSPYVPSEEFENASAEELELSKALIAQLEAQLEESRKAQESQREELRDCKDRLKKRDVEHKAFLLQYETEKKSWKDESKEKQARYQQELQSRDDDLIDTRQKLQKQIEINQNLREKQQDESKNLTSDAISLKEELVATKEENQKYATVIQELKEENQRLITESTRKEDLEKTQDEIKMQMKIAIDDQTRKTREFQSRIRELEGRHAQELDFWKSQVEEHRREIELNSTRMETQLEEANARFADLERKHDREVKEWQLLLDDNITKAITDESRYDETESQDNLLTIGAGSTGVEALSPIRKEKNKSADNSPNDESKNQPNQSMTMIDDLLNELGEMDLERTAILKEINGDNDDSRSHSVKIGNDTSIMSANNKSVGEIQKEAVKSPEKSQHNMDEKNANVSVDSSDSEVLDETLHLLNNLKTMLTSQENVDEHEATVLERLEVLSELMQSQELSHLESTPAKPRKLDTDGVHNVSSISAANKDVSFVSAVQASAETSPWPALVAELRSRCEFLERDRDEVTRITEQILEMERAAHKAELEAAVAEVERKANEKLQQMQLEANEEMNAFYRNVCLQCEEEAFDYSDGLGTWTNNGQGL